MWVGVAVLLGPFAWAVAAASLAGSTRRADALAGAWARTLVRWLRADLRISGAEHITPGTPYVVVALHESLVDPAALLHLPLRLVFVGRSELFAQRYLGWILRATGQICSPEGSQRRARGFLAAADGALDRGRSVVVFPQGSVLGIEVAFREGIFSFAARRGVPVLPVVVAGTHRLWEHPFTPEVRFGEPVTVQVLPPVVAPASAVAVRALEGAMKQAALQDGHAPVRRFVPARDGYWDGYQYEIDPAFPELAAQVAAHRQRSG